jgi:hypothetical protein
MIKVTRKNVAKWFKAQSKYRVMFNSHTDHFTLRDVENNIEVGAFNFWEDAVVFIYDLLHDHDLVV